MLTYQERLERLARLVEGFSGGEDEEQDEKFVGLLKRVACVVHEAEGAGAPERAQIVDKACDIFDNAINWAYTDGDFEFLPSYAHSLWNPLVKGLSSAGEHQAANLNATAAFVQAFEQMLFGGSTNGPLNLSPAAFSQPWPETPHPHPKASRLSRFYEGVAVTATDATPVARNIFQARCEVTTDSIASPVNASISADNSALAVIGQGGWKNRDPTLVVYLLDMDPDAEEGDEEDGVNSYGDFNNIVIEPGLSEVAPEVTTDAARKLVFVADSHRIKSFSWGGDVAFNGWTPARGKNVHTMKSQMYNGPLVVLPGGRVARAGKGGAAVWNLDTLETHKRGRRVGPGKFNASNSWRDDGHSEIEHSTGTAPSATLTFAQDGLTPSVWHLHTPTGNVLCGESGHTSHKYGCYAVDLEAGGKTAARFLGHGGNLTAFSTSTGDANLFLTACGDGYARLFDVRHPLPVMTLDAGQSSEFCLTAQLVHPDGIPTVFTGGDRFQNVKTWDVRARGMVYELSTGNTAVRALAWDAQRATLYAATECEYMDRVGNTHGYRAARIPRWARDMPEDPMDIAGGGDDDEYNSEEEDDDGNCWPESAPHDERFFGYAYDAGDHSLLRYQFKEDPSSDVLPAYGDARMEDGYW